MIYIRLYILITMTHYYVVVDVEIIVISIITTVSISMFAQGKTRNLKKLLKFTGLFICHHRGESCRNRRAARNTHCHLRKQI